MSSSNHKNFLSLWGMRAAAVVLLAIALGASLFAGRIRATFAEEGAVAGANNLPTGKIAAVCTSGSNLIINGDAEADTAAIGDGSADQDVSAWENETGTFTVAKYGAPSGFPTSTDPGPANRGVFFFVGGFADTSSGSQAIDLTGCSSQIDSGTQQFNLSGFLGGFGPQDDSARVVLTFKDAANLPIGTASIGPVTATERNNVTGLIERRSIGIVPVGARSVEVLLRITRFQGVYNDGYADNLSFILAAPPNCLPLPSGAVAWWKAEGNGNDAVGTNNGFLQNGTTFATGLVGQAFSFDGVDDYITTPRTIQDDFTIEFWLNSTQISNNSRGQWYDGRGLVDAEVAGVTNDFGVSLLGGMVHFGTGNPDVTIRSGVVADGNWHHVAATRRRSTGELKLYVDGSEVASGVAGTQSLTAPNRILLGLLQTNINPFQGKLDEVATYDRVLSPQEIKSTYDAGIAGKCALPVSCSPVPSDPVAWWHAEGNASDSTGNNNGTLKNGATFTTGQVGQAFSLDGVDDYVDVSASTSLNVGAGNGMTINAWINPANISAQHPLVEWNNAAGGFGVHLWISVTCCVSSAVGPGNLYANLVDTNGTFHVISSAPGLIATNTYQHVAVTYDKTSGVATLYLNGGPVAQQNLGVFTPQTTYDMQLGARRSGGGSGTYKGAIDEVEIFSRALTASEIKSIYDADSGGECGTDTIQSLTLNPNSVNGGQPSTGTVTLATPAPAGGAVVNLSSSNTGVATVPSSLTITEGQTTGTFAVTTLIPTSDATAVITASYQTGSTSANLTVLSLKPDLTVSAASVPSSSQTDTAFNISWTVKNQGTARASAPWAERVWLSNDNQISSNDTLIGEFPFNSNLETNQTADRIQTITIARNAITQDGAYFLLIQTDANNQIIEGSNEDNNFLARPIDVTQQPRPDLVVDSIVAPNTAFFGQTILVQWSVKNVGGGPTNAQGWQDFVYLSSDNVPEVEDPFKIPVGNVSYLSAGESYTATAEVKIPQGLVGQYKVIVWTDGDGTNHRSNSFPHQVIEGDDENNFSIARPIQINAPTLPDLQTISVVAPEEVFAGGQMILNWRVENHGDGVIPPDQTNWLDKIYLSQDATLDVNTDRLVGSRPRSGALAQNEGYTVSNFSTTLPGDIAGDWFVFILADGDNQVYEFNNETNNANYDNQQPGSPMHIRATPPDLVIPTALTAPATGFSGQPLNLGWTVKNQGAFEAAPNWFDAVYLSSDQTLNIESDTLLTSVFRSNSLAPGVAYDATANVTMPSCISGTYYLFVLTDSRRQIFEFDPNLNAEANNSSQPRPIQIVDATPDLRVNAVGYPATGNAGQQISVNWTVANEGTGATASTKWTDRIYLTPTQTFDSTTALLIGSFDHIGALNNGEAYTRTESLAIPNAAQGSYFVTVLTDANNEVEECANNANNMGTGSQAIAISNSLPDLVVQTASSQSDPVGGQTVSVDWTVANQGTVAVNNPSWGDAVYFSNDAILSNDDVRLATAPMTGPLAIGATYNRHAQATLPVVPPGNYFLIIQADYLGNVFEGQHEDNNLRAIALTIQVPAIDLTVTTVDAPSTAFSGQDMTVNWTVLNNGSNPTIGSHWIDEVVLSLDQIDDPSDRVVGSKEHNGVLNSQTSYNDTLSVFVPQGFTGQYYVFVRTDRRNEVAESNENNNSALGATLFNLTPPADLSVTSIAPPSSASPGEPLTINWTTRNIGTNPATGSWSDAVYLSSDQIWDIGDILVGRQTQSGPVAPGQSYDGQLTVTLPVIDLGSYYFIVKTDAQNRVRETNETNNDGVTVAQTLIDVPELQIGVPRNTTLATGQERFYKTVAPAGETLRFTLGGQAGSANELFERFGLIASRNSFDFSFGRLNEADQEVIVPNSQAGNYFTLARSTFSTPSTQAVTVKAEVIPFGITSVSPNRVGDNGQVTITLKGARFDEGATVHLSGNGTTLNAATVIRVDSSTVKARFMFTNAPRGIYDVTLTNPSGQTSTQSGAVTIEQAVTAQPVITSVGNLRTRPHRSLSFFNQVSNRGNVDIQYVAVRTQVFRPNSSDQVTIINRRPDNSFPRKADFPTVDWNNSPATNSSLDHLTTDSFLYRDLSPGETIPYDTEIRGLNVDSSFVRSQAVGLTRNEMGTAMVETAEFIREELIERGIDAPHTETKSAFRDFLEGALDFEGIIEGVIEDAPSSYGSAFKSGLKQSIPDLAFSGARNGCNILVDNRVTDCGLKCSAKFGCCNIGVASYALASFESFSIGNAVFGALNAFMVGWSEAECVSKIPNCIDTCPEQPQPTPQPTPAGALGGDTDSEEFAPIFVNTPIDPNEKLSPDGCGEQRFVSVQREVTYTVNFENLPTATAYAQRIRITDHLDPNLDPRTLRLREIGFKQYRFQAPDNRAFFQQRVQLGPDLGNLLAGISAGIDISTGTVTWTLTAIDPATGEQPNGASLGLLPPNNEANDGQGFVTFTVKPKSTIATSTVIHNGATITFDTEAPINTNTVSNTIDAEAPVSAVEPLPPTQASPTFNISWSGLDAPNGSGLRNYDIFFSANNGPYQPLSSGTTQTDTQFTGEPGTTYRFYSIARDNAGNVEAAPDSPDAVTTIEAITPTPTPTPTPIPTPTPTPTPTVSPGQLIISEFRLQGLTPDDEFIELYNNTDAPINILNYQLTINETLPRSTSITLGTPGTSIIPARGHYLVAHQTGYSLGAYAARDLGYSFGFDFAADAGISLTNSANVLLDKVGFTTSPAGSCEGTCLTPTSATGQYSFVRRMETGTPSDSNNNVTDFILVATDPAPFGGAARLGAPGPENTTSPVPKNLAQIQSQLIDPTVSSASPPNRVRDSSPYHDVLTPSGADGNPATFYPLGTLSVQRRFVNNTGQPITRLRFRVVDVTTLNTPYYIGSGTQADIRVLSSDGTTHAPLVLPPGVSLKGVMLEQSGGQMNQLRGGGWNSILAADIITMANPLPANDNPATPNIVENAIDLQFLLGVTSSGSFRFFVIVEALP